MGHGSLRVWNDDEIAPNSGFPAHPHANMEIITYVREGAITHQDSLGNKGRTEAGDVQVMSAGSGIRHSEYNLEPAKTKIFQIWIEPTTKGGQPTWGAKPFPKSDRSGKLVTIASGIAHFSLPVFIVASIITRGIRFYLVAGLLYWFGEPIRAFIERRLTLVTTVFVVALVGGFVVIKYVI